MAVKLVANIQKFVGLATDLKPLLTAAGTPILEGSTFKELDTSIMYWFHEGVWLPEEQNVGPTENYVEAALEQLLNVFGTEPLNDLSPFAIKIADGGRLEDLMAAQSPLAGAAIAVKDGRQTVTTSGTAQQLNAVSTPTLGVTITALVANTGIVVVGGPTVIAAAATRRGVPLNPGDPLVVTIDDLSKVWLDVTVNGEGVSYTYIGAQ